MRRKGVWMVMGTLAVVAVAYSLMRVVQAPVAQPEAGGLAQKIFYYHVGSAVTMYVAYLVGFICSIMYLRKQTPKWDLLAATHNEIGLLFCTLVLITGPIWARPVWGTWWRWEPRLVTFLVLWFSYVIYFVFRKAMDNPRQRGRLAAVYGILAFLNIPLVLVSTRLWNASQQLHPRSVGLPPTMLATLLASMVALLLVYLLLARLRFKVAQVETELGNRYLKGQS